MITWQRLAHHVALCAALGSALATTDGRRRPRPPITTDLLDPRMRPPARHREGASIFADHRRPHHVIGI
jgi:hypothetical protein